MKALIGTKLGMTSIIGEDGKVLPVTVIEALPTTVTQNKSIETDGYNAVQIASGESKSVSKSVQGHLKKAKLESAKNIAEIRLKDSSDLAVGDALDVTVFEEGEKIQVTGISKGKGFAGTVKRHNFNTSAETHGGNGVVRKPGSIGSMYPQKVFKGKKMAGQMGGKQVSVKNLRVALVNKDKNIIGVVGAVPGPRKGTVLIQEVRL